MENGENKIEDNKVVSGLMRFGATFAVLVGAVLTFSLFHKINNVGLESTSDSVITITIGLIGPLFSLGGFFLLYLTLQNQRENFQRERFENNLFEMIKAHRTIVAEMDYEVPDDFIQLEKTKQPVSIKGHKIFVRIEKHFNEAWIECNEIFENHKSNNTIFKDAAAKEAEYKRLEKHFGNRLDADIVHLVSQINVIYLCVFYGVSANGEPILRQIFDDVYDSSFIDEIIIKLKNKPTQWSKYWDVYLNRNIERYFGIPLFKEKDFFKYYGGHQLRLGHYFRTYFMIVNYVNKQNHINFETKYDYIKLLRSQLSTYEQFVFYLNSISFLGRIWEIESFKNNNYDCADFDKKLITKYELIKNIPLGFFKSVQPQVIYPDVEFEAGNELENKKILKEKYN